MLSNHWAMSTVRKRNLLEEISRKAYRHAKEELCDVHCQV